jgi:hypothetical protein
MRDCVPRQEANRVPIPSERTQFRVSNTTCDIAAYSIEERHVNQREHIRGASLQEQLARADVQRCCTVRAGFSSQNPERVSRRFTS